MPSLVNINSVSPDLRDYLLGLNLRPSPTIKDNKYTKFLNTHTSIGLPFTVTYGNGVLAPSKNIFDSAELNWRPTELGLNKYPGAKSDIVDGASYIDTVKYINNSNVNNTAPYSLNNIQLLGSNTTSPNIYSFPSKAKPPVVFNPKTNEAYEFLLEGAFYVSGKDYTEVYSSSIYEPVLTGPGFPALTETKDTKGNVYGPNTNLNKYIGNVYDNYYVGPFLTKTYNIVDQKKGYLNEYGKLNVKDGQFDEAFNIVSSLAKGGVGINKGGDGNIGVVSNNDIRNTLVGRVLTASGKIGDTDLGIIGAERLAISLANNAVFKFQRQTIGKVNLQLFNYIDNNSSNNRIIKENFEITIPDNFLGKALDFIGDLAGFTSPKSQLGTEFFSFDDKLQPTLIGNIARANGMLDSTGKGQVKTLFDNVRASLNNSNFIRQGYAPGYETRGEILFSRQDAPRFNVYAYGDTTTGEILENSNYGNSRWTDTDKSGFEGDYFRYSTPGNAGNTGNESSATESGFVWADTNINIDKNDGGTLVQDADEIFGDSPSEGETNSLYQPNRKSILYKTKELFKTNNVQTMVNGHVTITEKSQIQTSVLANGMMSKGNAALTKYALEEENLTDLTNVYCRTWTPMDKYDQVRDLARHSSLNKQGGDYKRDKKLIEYSVLESTGFVKIASYLKENNESAKRYMFSIENLAWMDSIIMNVGTKTLELPNCEKGPNGGRIMWFPPYDIKFSESTTVNWDKHNFIGRGEPMYTYSNTERTGQLSFKIIIDHPNTINNKTNNVTKTDDHYASFFAGCNLEDLIPTDKTITTTKEIKTKKPKEEIKEEPDVVPPVFSVFFPNDNWNYPNDNAAYESGVKSEDGLQIRNEIVYTNNDKDEYLKPINYNNSMDKTYGAISPIGLTSLDYEDKRINYGDDYNPTKGAYLGLGMTVNSSVTVATKTLRYIDRTNFGLNANRFDDKKEDDRYLNLPGNEKYAGCKWGGWLAASARGSSQNQDCAVSYLTALKDHMNYKDGPCKHCVIKITGYASVQGNTTQYNKEEEENIKQKEKRNKLLSQRRANNIKKYFEDSILDKTEPKWQKRITAEVKGQGENDGFGAKYGGVKCTQAMDQDVLSCKLDRRVKVEFVNNPPPKKTETEGEDEFDITYETTTTVEEIKNALKDAYAECDYFAKIAENDPFTYKKITDKIKYFSPAFHSTTPEGFNARLTFLQQCTRQGPSLYTDTNKPDNLVFGRPPVCVLRIGDFYHTKIIIESMSFDYEPLVWDLNPEGVGVQPMIVNVSFNFAFIGGSSLDGPISRLQNAVSSNYFANTGLFDVRANKNGAAYAEEVDANKDLNNLYEDVTQDTVVPQIDEALTSKDEDYNKLLNGKLSLRFGEARFIDRVIGNFELETDVSLSKDYSMTLTTMIPDIKKKEGANLGDEVISTESTKGPVNSSIRFRSKGKTTNSLQKWQSYFTDTYEPYTGDKVGWNTYYIRMQLSLDSYVEDYMKTNNITEKHMTGDEADGWDYKKVNEEYITNNQYNYDFIITVDELNFKKTFKARWIPEFKVKSTKQTGTELLPGATAETKTRTYKYESYLSGGELTIVNEIKGTDNTVSYKTTDEEADDIKEAKKEARKKRREQRKTERDTKKQAKADKKQAKDEQKAKVAKDISGSLI